MMRLCNPSHVKEQRNRHGRDRGTSEWKINQAEQKLNKEAGSRTDTVQNREGTRKERITQAEPQQGRDEERMMINSITMTFKFPNRLRSMLTNHSSWISSNQHQMCRVRGMMMMSKPKPKHFRDSVILRVTGGRGGDGCASFEGRAMNKESPDGGHGGRGGDVVLVAKENVRDFSHLNSFHIKGRDGKNGSSQGKTGRKGEDVEIPVPLGTAIYRAGPSRKERQLMSELEEVEEGNEPIGFIEDREARLIHDLERSNDKFTIAQGGFPGRGNILQATKRFEDREDDDTAAKARAGGEGTSISVELRLKTIADACLVGYPNAGKSSLLGAVSSSRPKVAPYPFTTLHPHIGYIEFSDARKISLADLPGLVDGASQNRGMGYQFLQHVERCKVLVYVIDGAPETYERKEISTITEDLTNLVRELDLYMEGLSSRPSLVVVNKMDRPAAKDVLSLELEDLKHVAPPSANGRIFAVSARDGTGLEEFVTALRIVVDQVYEQDIEDRRSEFTLKNRMSNLLLNEDEPRVKFRQVQRIGRAIPGRRALLYRIKRKEATSGEEAKAVRGKALRYLSSPKSSSTNRRK